MPDPATAGLSTVFWVGSMSATGVEAAGAVVSTVVRVSFEGVCPSPVSSSRDTFSWAAGPAQELKIATVNAAKRILLKICSQRSIPAGRAYNTGPKKQPWVGLLVSYDVACEP